MNGRGLLRFTVFATLIFFAILLLTAAGASELPSPFLAAVTGVAKNGIAQSPFFPLLRGASVLGRAAGIFLTNMRFLGTALVIALLFRVRFAPVRVIAWIGAVYFLIAFIGNAWLGGIVIAAQSPVHQVGWPLLFVAGILPHGIFEIASYAAGLAVMVAASRPSGVMAPIWRWGVGAVACLAFAALIEAGVTPALLHAAVR